MLNLSTLGEGECVFYVDAEIANSAFDLGMAEQDLDSTQIAGLFVDDGCLGPAQRVRSVVLFTQTDAGDPLVDQSSVLSRADVISVVDATWKVSVR